MNYPLNIHVEAESSKWFMLKLASINLKKLPAGSKLTIKNLSRKKATPAEN